MSGNTIFNGNKVVFDAMVIINFHGLLELDKLISWAKGEIVIEQHIKKEIKFSKAGPIDLTQYIKDGSVIEEEISGQAQEQLFYKYFESTVGKTKIDAGEAACLTLAISKRYGLASDERAVREEFKSMCPNKICVSSWMIVDKAASLGLLGGQEAEDLKDGFFYV